MEKPPKHPNVLGEARRLVAMGRYVDTRHSAQRRSERRITLFEIREVIQTGHHEKSMKKNKKIQKQFVYEGYGFPVIFENVPTVHVRGVWTPDINYNKVDKVLLLALSQKPARLSGSEIRFIRHSFEMTLETFSKRFAVSHPAVIKWEKAGLGATGMNWATEKDIRLEVLRHVEKGGAKLFVEVYEELENPPKAEKIPLKVDLKKVA